MKIYTRTGDDGTTSLFSGGRVPKHHMRVECYGTVDELNSTVGAARTLHLSPDGDKDLKRIQHQLFNLGADLATPMDAKTSHIVRASADSVTWLEERIDGLTEMLPELKTFILPGGSPGAAAIHISRTVCRRAERLAVVLGEQEEIGENVIPYLNRLSDYLFTLARYENAYAGVRDVEWEP